MWGLLAIVALAAVVLFFVWVGDEEETDPEGTGPAAEQIMWSVKLTDMSQQEVTLKADLPLGTPTETWVDGLMLERGIGDRWQWNVEAVLPQPVVDIDAAAGCDELNAELDVWLQGIGAAEGEVFNWQARAFTQHTINKMRASDCEIDDSVLTGL